MHRLFVAVRPPPEIRAWLLDLMGGVAGIRWATEAQLHITLRYIGEVDRRRAEDVASALEAVRHPPLELRLTGVGAFERRGQPTVIWAGVAPKQHIEGLHRKVDQACVQAGLDPERRAYHPHVTLARPKPGSGSLESFLQNAATATSVPFAVEEFGLFESTLTPEGAVYTLAQRYRLR